jgi:ComEC/Rec2-related protein
MPIEHIQLVGSVSSSPYYQTYNPGRAGVWIVPLHCEGIKSDGVWRRHRGAIRGRIAGLPAESSFRQGQRILFIGTLQDRRMPGGEPFELRVDTSSDPFHILSDPPVYSQTAWGQRLRESAARKLEKGNRRKSSEDAVKTLSGEEARNGVYQALLLGYRKAIPPGIHEQFRRTGTLHIFAISGLHVGIVGLLLTVVLKTLGIPRNLWAFYLLPLLAVYVAVTGMKSSALRAFTMAGVYFLSPLFRRKPDVPSSIAFAAILLLFCFPKEILAAGFIYSFTVVSFIVLFFARTPKEFIFSGVGRLRTVRSYVVSLCVTSIAAFVGSTPLTALFFGSFTPVSLIGNLMVVPLTFCIVLSGWLAIIAPGVSIVFNSAAHLFIDVLLTIVGVLSALPGAHVRVPPPPLTAVLFWYWGWIFLLAHPRTKRDRRAPILLITLSILLTMLAGV